MGSEYRRTRLRLRLIDPSPPPGTCTQKTKKLSGLGKVLWHTHNDTQQLHIELFPWDHMNNIHALINIMLHESLLLFLELVDMSRTKRLSFLVFGFEITASGGAECPPGSTDIVRKSPR
jgi:hypothetical protein